MSDRTIIAWTDKTWNPWRGCTKIDPGWNEEGVKELILELNGEINLELTGFDADEVSNLLLDNSTDDAEPQLDRASELQKQWKTKLGQLWKLGEHRLLCGDSLDPSCLNKLMARQKWDVAIIDPPFERDDLPHLSDPSIVFGQAKHVRLIPDDLFRFERIIDKVTAHRSATINIGHRHAFIVQVGKIKKLPHSKQTYPSIVVCDSRPEHPHEKPVWLLKEHLSLWTPPWKIAFDPFSGSGTTIMACEQMGRCARAIELSPGYVAVTLQRFLDATGKQPTLA